MEEQPGFGFDEFSVEMGDFEMRKVKEFERVWKIGYGGSLTTSMVPYGGLIYFGCADFFVYAIDPANGRLVWKFRTEGSIAEGSPTIHEGVLYVGSFDQNLYAIRAHDGRLLWKFRTRDMVACTPRVDGGVVYFGSKDQNIYALDSRTGELLWKFRTFGGIISEPTIVGNKLIMGSYDHNLYCLDKRSGELLWKVRTQGEVHNANAIPVNEGLLYFSSFDNFLRAVDLETGDIVWRLKVGQYGSCVAPVIHKGVIYQACRDGILYAVSMDGRLLWKYVTKDNVGVPNIVDDRIYLGSCDFTIHCIDLRGRKLWNFKTNGYVWWRPALIGSKLIFGSWDCFVYCIDINERQAVWKFRTSGGPSPVPPANEAFELVLKIPKKTEEEERKKTYDLDMVEENDGTSAYKSRITYQVSTQYQSKGKYQIDSDEEAF
ncbi:MAG: PQQ-binding-like beta-propeller repeat protein [Candidatus Aenigmarchaeota archaeon]|nr:PQQ-binding-like beta-propeller repeat protein [Candidatus Aenigmarchaeota archaeon]